MKIQTAIITSSSALWQKLSKMNEHDLLAMAGDMEAIAAQIRVVAALRAGDRDGLQVLPQSEGRLECQ